MAAAAAAAAATTTTVWSKDDPDEEVAHYSDWKITLSKKQQNNGTVEELAPIQATDDNMELFIPTSDDDDGRNELDEVGEMKITITSTTTARPLLKPVTFHVHRCIVGPKSGYFTKIFLSSAEDTTTTTTSSTTSSSSSSSKSKSKKSTSSSSLVGSSSTNTGVVAESSQQHSRIVFPPSLSDEAFELIVEAFEAFLNFCYDTNKSDDDGGTDDAFDGESPLPLLFLCDYFHMDPVFDASVQAYSEELLHNMSTERKLHLIYDDIIEYRQAGMNVDRVQSMVSRNCYLQQDLLSKGSQLADIADLPLWLEVVSIIADHQHQQDVTNSIQWSRNIVYFLENNEKSSGVDATTFKTLTGTAVLPCICKQSSSALLREEELHRIPATELNDARDDVDINPSTFVTTLQRRCVQSFVEAKLEDGTDDELREEAIGIMSVLPNSNVMECYLRRVLEVYRDEKVTLRQHLAAKGTEYRQVQEELHKANASLDQQHQYLRIKGENHLIRVPTMNHTPCQE